MDKHTIYLLAAIAILVVFIIIAGYWYYAHIITIDIDAVTDLTFDSTSGAITVTGSLPSTSKLTASKLSPSKWTNQKIVFTLGSGKTVISTSVASATASGSVFTVITPAGAWADTTVPYAWTSGDYAKIYKY